MFIDSHAHLLMINKERGIEFNQIFEEMNQNKVTTVIDICGNEDELIFFNETSVLFKNQNFKIYAAAGIHPHEAEKYINSDLSWIIRNKDNILAIGEVGLDFFYNFSSHETQEKMLRKMIDISLETKKPLIIHGRNAEEKIIQILSEYSSVKEKVLFHCYTGSSETAEKIFKKGWFISFSGILTFKKSSEISEIFRNSPLDQILFETDSPFLSPNPHRGKVNTPGKVSFVYNFASNFLNVDSAFLEDRVTSNFNKFFELKI